MDTKQTRRLTIWLLILSSTLFGFLLASLMNRPGNTSATGFAPDFGGLQLTETNGDLPPQSFMQIAADMSDVVVNIEAKLVQPKSTTVDGRNIRSGSGFIIDAKGYILTNSHVIDRTNKILVRLRDNSIYPASVVGADRSTDLALLKIDPEGELKSASLGDSDLVHPGEWVITIGNPSGLSHTVTVGVVSAIERDFGGNAAFTNYIQTDAAINPGNSGGPLMNIRGEVIGINTLIFQERQNLGFSIPINLAKLVIKQLKENGKVERGYLGLTPGAVTEEIQELFGLSDRKGAVVESIQKSTPHNITTPAFVAGLKAGDVITRFDGKEIRDVGDLYLFAAYTPPGKTVRVEFIRHLQNLSVDVTLMKRPSVISADAEKIPKQLSRKNDHYAGMKVVNIADNIKRELSRFTGIETLSGVQIESLDPASPIFELSLEKGDFIVSVNDKPVNTARDIREAVEEAIENKRAIVLYRTRFNGNNLAGKFISIPYSMLKEN